jgi:hypothetical protein
MSMEIDIFAETDYGKIALKKINPTDPNFRLYEAGWLGKHGKSDVMEVKGAVFRVAKTGPYKGKLGVKVQGTEEVAYVTADELKSFGKYDEKKVEEAVGRAPGRTESKGTGMTYDTQFQLLRGRIVNALRYLDDGMPETARAWLTNTLDGMAKMEAEMALLAPTVTVMLSPCLIAKNSSRVCMLGTKGCVLVHPAACVADTNTTKVTK